MAEWKVIEETGNELFTERLQEAEAEEWEVMTIQSDEGQNIAYLRKKHNWGKTIKGEGQVEG